MLVYLNPRVGCRVRVTRGHHAGKAGVIKSCSQIRCLLSGRAGFTFLVDVEGETFWVSAKYIRVED